jgi:4-amino-4-deoxy-L-arabinose transferase-like glycosyltransferase
VSKFWRIWWIALAVKTAIAVWLPFANDESYYWVWGHHPQLSYFDHPPMVGWLYSLGTLFENFGNAARWPGVWLGHLTLLLWREILKPYLNKEKEAFWLVLVLFSPFLGIGSLIITPDAPLMFFWTLSLYLFIRFMECTRAQNLLLTSALLGASLGLGFCSKYLIVLFIPCVFLWLIWSGDWRKVRWTYLPVTIGVGLLFCWPVLYWNYKHEWVSFAFQLNHGLGASEKPETYSFGWPFEYLAGQIGILFPTVIWLSIRRRETKTARILHAFGWLPIGFFLFTSFQARVEANWPSMAHPAILALAVINMENFQERRSLIWTRSLWITALLLAFLQVIHPWIPIDAKKLKTNEYVRFNAFQAPAIVHGADFFLDSYQMAADVSYKLRRQFYKLGGMNRPDFYDLLPQSYPVSDHFYVGAEIGHPLPKWVAEKGYVVVATQKLSKELQVIEVQKRAPTARP